MTPEAILLLVSSALAIVFEYVPVLHENYNKLPNSTQRLTMLALIAASTVALLASKCIGEVACYSLEWRGALEAFVMALGVNQGAFMALKIATRK